MPPMEDNMKCGSVKVARMCALTLVISCRQPSTSVKPVSSRTGIGCAASLCGVESDKLITVTYLGVSGLLIQHAGHVMLTAPFRKVCLIFP